MDREIEKINQDNKNDSFNLTHHPRFMCPRSKTRINHSFNSNRTQLGSFLIDKEEEYDSDTSEKNQGEFRA